MRDGLRRCKDGVLCSVKHGIRITERVKVSNRSHLPFVYCETGWADILLNPMFGHGCVYISAIPSRRHEISGIVRNVRSVSCALRLNLSLIHISEPTRQAEISYAVFCLK